MVQFKSTWHYQTDQVCADRPDGLTVPFRMDHTAVPPCNARQCISDVHVSKRRKPKSTSVESIPKAEEPTSRARKTRVAATTVVGLAYLLRLAAMPQACLEFDRTKRCSRLSFPPEAQL